MDWLIELFRNDSVAHSILILALVIAFGLALGSLRICGISLGIAGVMFSGLLFGHFNMGIHHDVLHFVREFGLILFVFTIGLQVGPGFFASLKRQGLSLNLMAAAVVTLGLLITLGIHKIAGIPIPAASGLFSGATTNTPSLAAGAEALRQFPDLPPETLKIPGMAYAIAYPFGILGIILVMLLVRRLFRIDLAAETRAFEESQRRNLPEIRTLSLRLENANLNGASLAAIPGLQGSNAVISRILRNGDLFVPQADTLLQTGDVLHVVGPPKAVETLRLAIGKVSEINLTEIASPLTSRRIVATRQKILGKTLEEVSLLQQFGATVTRIQRGDQEFSPGRDYQIQFGDVLRIVGKETAIQAAEQTLGNSLKRLNTPHIIPLFTGIALGVIAGSLPLAIPGLPAAVKMGLAGGPLLIALLLSRLGHLGPLVFYMPLNANYMLRELGIALFLACVGLNSGDTFWHILSQGDGLRWMALATLITFVPLLLVAVFARLVMKLNYISLCGLLAGSMTDPPALAFANQLVGSESPAISYVTIYPLTMILRVLYAQLFVLYFLVS